MVWNLIRSWSSGTSEQCHSDVFNAQMGRPSRICLSLYQLDMLCLHRGLIVDKDLGNLCKVDRFGCAPAGLPAARCHAFHSINIVPCLI